MHKDPFVKEPLRFGLFAGSPVVVGMSTTAYGNMAMPSSTRPGEDRTEVQKRRGEFLRNLELAPVHPPFLVVADVQHGDVIVDVGYEGRDDCPKCDALVTQATSVVLWMNAADCITAPMYDPITKTVALVHVGYPGAELGLIPKVLAHLRKEYGVDPGNLLVQIPPCWQGEVFEGSLMERLGPAFQTDSWQRYIRREGDGGYVRWVDRVVNQLHEGGVREKNMRRSRENTATDTRYFSRHRWAAEGKKEIDGRHAMAVCLKSR